MPNIFLPRRKKNISPWLDSLALQLWGALLLKYAFTGQLALLIHPNYFGICMASGIVLMLLGVALPPWLHALCMRCAALCYVMMYAT